MAKKSLVIVESPAKAKTINKYLGSNFDVTASVGHIIDLPKTKLGVSIEEGFKPQYVKIRGKEKIIKELKNKASQSDKVYLATDPDREGEAIAYHISTILDKDKADVYRVEFNEITKNAVDEAMRHPRGIDMRRVYSQQARRVLDRIVGYKISPLLWEIIYRGLSAGRVQSVALRLICEREEEIRNFTPEEFWNIFALAKPENLEAFRVKLAKIGGKKAKISNQEEAQKHLKEIRKQAFAITAVQKKEVKRQSPPPFTTSTLQQVASRQLRMSTRRVMQIAQSLYEGVEIPGQGSVGLITYMRTDSTRISPVAIDAVRTYITEQIGKEFLPERPRQYKTKKTAQDAHEAIRPTYITAEFTPEALKDKLSPEQFRLYDLIWKRFVACQMKPAVFEKTVVEVQGGDYLFSAEGEVMKFPGFMKIYKEDAEQNGGNGQANIPLNLEKGLSCELTELTPEQNFTKPPARYTESTLVKELDRLGIGRPSTYAQIVSTILQRQYVERKEQKLFATELGETVNKILVNGFPDLFNVSFTAKMEEKLDEIAQNGASYEQVMSEFYQSFEQDLEKVKQEKTKLKSLIVQETDEVCEKCGRPMVIRWGRNGKFLACSGFPECRNTKPLTEEEQPQETGEVCELCGSPMVIKRGRFGSFLACSNYPKCKNTKPLTLGIACPKEGCDGQIVERRTKRGRIFYGCSNYPKCDFVSWDKPVNKKCPQCGNNYMVEKNLKSKGHILRCPNCKHEEPFDE
jgi:DNA topoisomerase-1